MFLGKSVQDLAAVGNQLFWYDNSAFNFALARYDDATGKQIAYTFPVGAGNLHNYRASATIVVTADPKSDPVVYHAYDVNPVNTEVGSTTMPKPSGAQWSAYAVSDGTVYIMDTATPGTTTLMKWIPGQSPTAVTTLESAGVKVGEFWDFSVSGNTMVFIEGGRIWKMDIAANKATWLMNKSLVAGDASVDFRDDGVMFSTDTALMFFDYNKGVLENVTDLINHNPYKISETYSTAAKFDQQDFWRWKRFVLYIGNSGLFGYDLVNDKVTPIVLSPISDALRVDYRYPVALDDGTAFVTGLMSTSGLTGADGPTFKLDLNPIFQ